MLIVVSAWTVVPVYHFISGSADYFTGSATFKYVGMPDVEFYNLDPTYRAWNSTSGCIMTGLESFTHKPNNLAIKCWSRLLGFQKNVYAGVYPDRITAAAWLRDSGKITSYIRSDGSYTFQIRNQTFHLTDFPHRNMESTDSVATARVAILQNSLILFQPVLYDNETVILLADFTNGKIFAHFNIPQDYKRE